MKYLLGVDFGGGSSKATLLAGTGDIAAVSVREYPTYYPQDGWAEQNPDDSFNALVYNIRNILKTTGVNPADIAALSLDGATHTAVLLDQDDRVIRPAIYWTDKRSFKESEYLVKHHADLLIKTAGNSASPLWTLPQLMWVRNNEPENFRKIAKILFMKDYVRYRLTGDFVTDHIEAMGALLMDINTNCWSKELCSLCGISPAVLPKIVNPDDLVSPLTGEACKATGLTPATRVLAGSTDTVMEVYASGAVRKGQATVKLATAGRICAVTDRGYPHPLLVNYRHIIPGLWYPGTATKSSAASYRWYRDVLGADETSRAAREGLDPYCLMDKAAEQAPPGADNLFFHPYLQGEITPYLDNALKASFTGVSSFHTKAHFNRAVLEGVAYSLKDCFNVLCGLGIDIRSAGMIGGGAKSPLWRQIVADVLGIRLTKAVCDDSSFGSAMMAGVASGVFSSYEDSVEKCVKTDMIINPNPENRRVYEKGFLTYRKIHDALAPIYRELAGQE